MIDTANLFHRLATLAEQRSRLLIEESRLWADASRVLFDAGTIPSAPSEKKGSSHATEKTGERELLATNAAAEFLGLSKSTMDKWRLTGGGPEFVKLGRRIFYRKPTLVEFIEKHAFPHTSAYGVKR